MNKKIAHLRNFFIEGLLFLIPIIITVYICIYLIKLIHKLMFFTKIFIPKTYSNNIYIEYLFVFISLIIFIITIFLLGLFMDSFIGKFLKKAVSKILLNIPVINYIYNSLKQLMDFIVINSKTTKIISNVVIVPYNNEEIYCYGFVMGRASKKINDNEELLNVYIPGTPNAASGFMFICRKEDIINTNLSYENGLKMIITGGIINSFDEENY